MLRKKKEESKTAPSSLIPEKDQKIPKERDLLSSKEQK